MYDADALEAINGEQLVTATDRLLLRGGQLSKRRHIRRLAEGSQPHIVIARLAEGSQPDFPVGSVGFVADATARASHLAPRARSADAGDRTQVELTSDQVGDSTQVDLVADFAIDVATDVATDDLVDRTQPDRRLACAWETTVPHPLSRRVGAQPYAGTIVAAPFASVPHPLPPVRDSSVEYVMCALRLSELDPVPGPHVEYVAVSAPEPVRSYGAPSGILAAAKGSLVTTSHASLAFIAAAPFASDSYPALHGRPSLPNLDDVTGPLPAGFDPSSASRARAAQLEPTAVVRCPKVTGAQVFALTVVVPALVGIAVGLAALL
jgi:hypothetical protein